MQQIMLWVILKNDHYGEPEIFLDSQLQWKNTNGSECWTMTSNKYVTEALKTLKFTLKEKIKQLPSRASTPLSYKYKPEVDDTAELNAAETRFYEELIGV